MPRSEEMASSARGDDGVAIVSSCYIILRVRTVRAADGGAASSHARTAGPLLALCQFIRLRLPYLYCQHPAPGSVVYTDVLLE